MCRAHPSLAAPGPDAFCELSYRRDTAGDLLNVRFEHNTRQHATIESWEHGIARFLEERGADAAFVRAARGGGGNTSAHVFRAQLRSCHLSARFRDGVFTKVMVCARTVRPVSSGRVYIC